MERLEGNQPIENKAHDEEAERVRQAEVILRFADTAKNIKPFHGQSVQEVFSSEENKRAFIDSLDTLDFIELLNGTNGILRDKEKEEWGMDGKGVGLTGALLGLEYVSPAQEDKPELLGKVLSAAKEMNLGGRDLRDIALLISSSLNAIHPYADANGRTSRLIYLLLTNDFGVETKLQLRDVLLKYGREKVDINPGLIQGELVILIDKEVGIKDKERNIDNITNLFWGFVIKEVEFSVEVSKEHQELFRQLLENDAHNMYLAVFKFLENNPNKDKYLQRFPNRSAVDVKMLTKDLAVEEVDRIIELYKGFKKRYVEKLIDCVAYPDKEEHQIEFQGKRAPLSDLFKSRIKEQV